MPAQNEPTEMASTLTAPLTSPATPAVTQGSPRRRTAVERARRAAARQRGVDHQRCADRRRQRREEIAGNPLQCDGGESGWRRGDDQRHERAGATARAFVRQGEHGAGSAGGNAADRGIDGIELAVLERQPGEGGSGHGGKAGQDAGHMAPQPLRGGEEKDDCDRRQGRLAAPVHSRSPCCANPKTGALGDTYERKCAADQAMRTWRVFTVRRALFFVPNTTLALQPRQVVDERHESWRARTPRAAAWCEPPRPARTRDRPDPMRASRAFRASRCEPTIGHRSWPSRRAPGTCRLRAWRGSSNPAAACAGTDARAHHPWPRRRGRRRSSIRTRAGRAPGPPGRRRRG